MSILPTGFPPRTTNHSAFTEHVSAQLEEYRAFSIFLCRRYLRNPGLADDVLQDALETTWRAVRTNGIGILSAGFVHAVMRNVCMRHLKYRRRRCTCDASNEMADDRASIDEGYERRNRLFMALRTLDAEDRDRLLLFCVGGVSADELGRMEQVSVVCVRKRLERSRSKVRRHLSGKLPGTAASARGLDVLAETLRLLVVRGSVRKK